VGNTFVSPMLMKKTSVDTSSPKSRQDSQGNRFGGNSEISQYYNYGLNRSTDNNPSMNKQSSFTSLHS